MMKSEKAVKSFPEPHARKQKSIYSKRRIVKTDLEQTENKL